MVLSDTTGENLDPSYQSIVVVFNATPNALSYPAADFTGMGYILHPVLAASYDAVAQTASFDSATGTFNVPAWTTSVFVLPE
jgi:hypothetical protein